MATFGPVVLSYGDSLIRQSEIDILRKPKAWLNDVLLSFYMEYLENSCEPPLKDRVKFYAATISQFIKLCNQAEEVATFFMDINPANVQFAFWPISDGGSFTDESGSHWSLLVYSRPDDAFIHYDSVNSSANCVEAATVARKLALVFSPRSIFVVMPTTPQTNSHDCGLHTLANAERILEVIKNRMETNKRFSQLTSAGSQVITVNAADAFRLRSRMIELIQRLGGSVQQQVQMLPRLPAPAPHVRVPQLQAARLRGPQLPAPQVPGPLPVENVQHNLAHMSLT